MYIELTYFQELCSKTTKSVFMCNETFLHLMISLYGSFIPWTPLSHRYRKPTRKTLSTLDYHKEQETRFGGQFDDDISVHRGLDDIPAPPSPSSALSRYAQGEKIDRDCISFLIIYRENGENLVSTLKMP